MRAVRHTSLNSHGTTSPTIRGNAVSRKKGDGTTRNISSVRVARSNINWSGGCQRKLLVVDHHGKRSFIRCITRGNRKVTATKHWIGFNVHVANDSIQTDERRGTRQIKHRATTRFGEDFGNR
jgi:hypothetical protein